MLAGDELGELALARIEQLAEREQDALPSRERERAPRREGRVAESTAASISLRFARATRLVSMPRAGSYTGAVRPLDEGDSAPSIQCGTTGSSVFVLMMFLCR